MSRRATNSSFMVFSKYYVFDPRPQLPFRVSAKRYRRDSDSEQDGNRDLADAAVLNEEVLVWGYQTCMSCAFPVLTEDTGFLLVLTDASKSEVASCRSSRLPNHSKWCNNWTLRAHELSSVKREPTACSTDRPSARDRKSVV